MSDRKLRLFAACCQRVPHHVSTRSRIVGVEPAEGYVDGQVTEDEIDEFVSTNRTICSLPIATTEPNAAIVQPCLEDLAFDGSCAAYFAANYSAVAMDHHRSALSQHPTEMLDQTLVEEEKMGHVIPIGVTQLGTDVQQGGSSAAG